MSTPRRGRRDRARGVRAVILVGAASAYAAACVRIDPAPNGVAAARLDAAPPSVALGDTLRDSLGVAYRVHGSAYDAAGQSVPTATFRYSYVPFRPDTTAGAVVDTALVVDSATGAVRATASWLKSGNGVGISSGRVLARIGAVIQLADTIEIVPRPNALVATAAVDTLRFDCTDPRLTFVQRGTTDSVGTFVNTVGPFTVVVRGDSLGTSVPVRRWLVRWSLDAVPAPVPTVALASGGTVPAIGVITNALDRIVSYDTTDGTGTSNVRLRIRPTALGKTYVADTLFRVTLRADVIAGAGVPVSGSPARGVFSVLLSRRSVPPPSTSAGVTCQR